uniref:Uncharacterized protein n=1 Tax=Setaria italica TaxID=4555 RepID=K3YFF6_SETIT
MTYLRDARECRCRSASKGEECLRRSLSPGEEGAALVLPRCVHAGGSEGVVHQGAILGEPSPGR